MLWAGIDDGNHLQISVLAKKKRKSPLSLVHVAGVIPDADIESADAFTTSIMHSAYYGNGLLVMCPSALSHSPRPRAAQTAQGNRQPEERTGEYPT